MRRRRVIQLVVIATISTILGCATQSQDSVPDLVQKGYLHLEHSPHEGKVRAVSISVREQNDGLVISGFLKQYRERGRPLTAHVDITVHSPEGRVLAEKQSQDLYVPRNRISGGPERSKRFSVRLDSVPPANSVIQIVTHRGTHD